MRRRSLKAGVELGRLQRVRPRELGVRFAFGAVISLAAGLVGLRLGHHAGGLFLAFPAIMPASLTLIESKSGNDQASVNALGAVLGAVGLAAFAACAMLALRAFPAPLALLLATLAWLLAAGLAYLAATAVFRASGWVPAPPARRRPGAPARKVER